MSSRQHTPSTLSPIDLKALSMASAVSGRKFSDWLNSSARPLSIWERPSNCSDMTERTSDSLRSAAQRERKSEKFSERQSRSLSVWAHFCTKSSGSSLHDIERLTLRLLAAISSASRVFPRFCSQQYILSPHPLQQSCSVFEKTFSNSGVVMAESFSETAVTVSLTFSRASEANRSRITAVSFAPSATVTAALGERYSRNFALMFFGRTKKRTLPTSTSYSITNEDGSDRSLSMTMPFARIKAMAQDAFERRPKTPDISPPNAKPTAA